MWLKSLVAGFLLLSLGALGVAGENTSIGSVVFLKPGALVTEDGEKVSRRIIPIPAKIEDVDGDLVSISGIWIRKDDVLTPDEALAFFSAVIRDSPARADAWNSRGLAWQAKGQHKRSLDDFKEALRLQTNDPVVYMNLANAYSNITGEAENTVANYSMALRLDPNEPRIHFNLGVYYFREGQLQNAIQSFSSAIANDPKMFDAYVNRGSAWNSLRNYDEAIKDLTAAIEIRPDDFVGVFTRAQFYINKRDYRNSLNDYNKAIELAPKNPAGYCGGAELLAAAPLSELRDGKKALEDARMALELSDETNVNAISSIAAAYAERGEFAKSMIWQERAIDLISTETGKAKSRRRLALFEKKMPLRYPAQIEEQK